MTCAGSAPRRPGAVVPDAPLIDLPMGGTRQQYAAVMAELMASDHCDAVLAVLGNSARLRPDQVDDNILCADVLAKPLAVFIAPQAEQALAKLDAAGVAGFRTPETCADALHAYLAWRRPRSFEAAPLTLAEHDAGALDEARSCAVFAALGIETPAIQVVRDPAELRAVAAPVAVKLLSPDILHKTEAGLVHLNVVGPAAAAASVTALLDRAAAAFPQARIHGVLVAPMQRGLAEVILGYRRDPEVGPVVMLGMGGVLAELRPSLSVRLAPVDEAEAAAMVAELPELRALAGFRNLPRGDLAALARAVAAISRLAGAPVQDAEINPLIIRPDGQGVVAVDGLVVLDGVAG